MKDMHFSNGVQLALDLARQEAVRLQHEKIGIEHLLFGLLSAEKEIGKHSLQEASLLLISIQEILNSFAKKKPFRPENLGFSSDAMHILELATDESNQRGFARIGIDAVLLGFASDPNGIRLLDSLGISPIQVRENVQYKLLNSLDLDNEVSSIPSTKPLSFREELLTPEHIIDVRKLLDRCSYPLYVLASKSQSFYLCKTEFGIGRERHLRHVGFEFAYPNCSTSFDKVQHVQRVRVENWSAKSLGDMRLWITLDSIDTMITDNLLHFPNIFRALFDKKDINQSRITNWRQILEMVKWKPYIGSGLNFNIAHWNEASIPVGWAYSDKDEPLIVIATLGVLYTDFLKILDSLTILGPDDNTLINKFQEEMQTAQK